MKTDYLAISYVVVVYIGLSVVVVVVVFVSLLFFIYLFFKWGPVLLCDLRFSLVHFLFPVTRPGFGNYGPKSL